MLISMQREPEREEMPGQVEMDEPSYPEGLCIKLESDDLKKLNITAAPKIGSEMMIQARVYVSEAGAVKTQGGTEAMLKLQITDMSISGVERTMSAATMLYGSPSAT
jgi:hypothetical protein